MRIPFSPPPGINSDDTTFAAEGQWADGNNVRFRQGKPETIKWWAKPQFTGGGDITLTLTGTCRKIIEWRDGSTTLIGFGTTTKLQSWDGSGGLDDITPSGFTSADTWCLDTWGTDLLAAPGSGTLYVWAGTGLATEVTQAPDVIIQMLVTEQRQVMALGTNEESSGTFNHQCIRWSDLEDYTDWTTTSTNNAGEQILDTQGVIYAARRVGPYIAVWTSLDLWLGEFIGDPAQTYRFQKVAGDCGILGPNAVEVVGQTAYWTGFDKRFYSWTVGSVPQAIPCPIWKDFLDNADSAVPSYDLFACQIPQHQEVRFFYQDERDGTSEVSRHVTYCVGESLSAQRHVWYRGQLAFSAWLPASDPRFYGGIIAVDTSDRLMAPENGNNANAAAPTWFIQSADQYIDEGGREMEIQRIVPDSEDQTGSVNLTLYVRQRPKSSATTKGPHVLTTTTTKKDFRASGNLVSVKFEDADATNSFWRMGKPVFTGVAKGARG